MTTVNGSRRKYTFVIVDFAILSFINSLPDVFWLFSLTAFNALSPDPLSGYADLHRAFPDRGGVRLALLAKGDDFSKTAIRPGTNPCDQIFTAAPVHTAR
jgi:hypothetical protein